MSKASLSQPRESTITKAIVRKLNSLDRCHAQKIHGGPYGSPTVDIMGVLDGRAFFLEVKVPGKHATPRQESTLRRWGEVGALVGVVHSVEEALKSILGPQGGEK